MKRYLLLGTFIITSFVAASRSEEGVTVIRLPRGENFIGGKCINQKGDLRITVLICPNSIEIFREGKLSKKFVGKVAFSNVIFREDNLYFQKPMEFENIVTFPYYKINALTGQISSINDFEAVYGKNFAFSFSTTAGIRILDIDNGENLRIETYFKKKQGKPIILGPRAGCNGWSVRAGGEPPTLYGFKDNDFILSVADSCGDYFVYISYQNQVSSQYKSINLTPLRLEH